MNPTRKPTEPRQNHFVTCVCRFSKSKKAWVIILWRQVVPHPCHLLKIINFNSKYCWISHIFFTGKRPLFSFLMSCIFNFNLDYLGWMTLIFFITGKWPVFLCSGHRQPVKFLLHDLRAHTQGAQIPSGSWKTEMVTMIIILFFLGKRLLQMLAMTNFKFLLNNLWADAQGTQLPSSLREQWKRGCWQWQWWSCLKLGLILRLSIMRRNNACPRNVELNDNLLLFLEFD